ncbi:MAG: hypothetical protein ABIL06_26940 [Pseudomonadota bacterium]
MKKIAVCVKRVLQTGEIAHFDQHGKLRTEGIRYETNRSDLHAVEEASRLLSRFGGEGILLTLGPEKTEATLRECLAYGEFNAYRIDTLRKDPEDPTLIARTLAQILQDLSPDIIFCGEVASDDQFGQMGSRIAEHLGICAIGGVVHVTCMEGGNEIEVQRRLLRGAREVLRAPLPVVICVNPMINLLRYVNIPALFRAKRAKIEVIPDLFEQVKASTETYIRRIEIGPPRKRPKRIFVPDASLSGSERLAQLLTGGMTKKGAKKDAIIESPPKEAAKEIYAFLKKEGFLEDS